MTNIIFNKGTELCSYDMKLAICIQGTPKNSSPWYVLQKKSLGLSQCTRWKQHCRSLCPGILRVLLIYPAGRWVLLEAQDMELHGSQVRSWEGRDLSSFETHLMRAGGGNTVKTKEYICRVQIRIDPAENRTESKPVSHMHMIMTTLNCFHKQKAALTLEHSPNFASHWLKNIE